MAKRAKTALQRGPDQPEESTSSQPSTFEAAKELTHSRADDIEKKTRELLHYTSDRLSHRGDEPFSTFLEAVRKERHSLEKDVDKASEITKHNVVMCLLTCVVANLNVIGEADRNKSGKVKNC